MLLQSEAREVTRSGVMETAKATIKTSAKVFNFFADQTYANKPKAICRELVANAWDSHMMAGKGKIPVEVWLPNLVDPVFKVRDHGLGMSHEFMMTNFMQYADGSTKDQSNVAIGGFGIGSKSPFAYVDQYTMRVVFDGLLSLYSVFKDEDGIPSIALLQQKSTDEENGVEVSFPVEPADFNVFQQAAFEALKYFDPLPTMYGAGQKKFEAVDYAAKGKTWGMRKTSGPLQVIMGGVMYPVDPTALSYKFNDVTAKRMLTYGLDIRVDIGTCSIALSREALSYDDVTVAGLTKACLAVVDEVAASFATMFDQYDTLWDARQALSEEVHPTQRHGHYGGQSVRGGFLAENAKWKGKPLQIQFDFMVPGGFSSWEVDPKTYRRSGANVPNPRWEEYEQYALKTNPGAYEHVIIDDLPRNNKSRAIAKIKEFIQDELTQDKKVWIIRPADESLKPKIILDALGNPSKYTLTSTLPEPTTVANPKGVRPRIRMFTYTGYKGGRYNYGFGTMGFYDNLMPGRYGKTGVAEVAYADQPTSGIIVALDKWAPGSDFYTKMLLEIVSWNELHFANKGDVAKLDPKAWIPFEKVFQKRLKSKIGAYKGLGAMLAVEKEMPERLVRRLFCDPKWMAKPMTKGPLAELYQWYLDYVKPIKSDHRKYGPFVDIKLPDKVEPQKTWEAFEKKHPRAFRLLELMDHRFETDDDQAFFLSLI